MVARISIQPMRDEDGDNGVALKSLYDLFQFTRKTVSEMEPTPNATGTPKPNQIAGVDVPRCDVSGFGSSAFGLAPLAGVEVVLDRRPVELPEGHLRASDPGALNRLRAPTRTANTAERMYADPLRQSDGSSR